MVGPNISDLHPASVAANAATRLPSTKNEKQSATRNVRLCPSIDNGVSKSSNNVERQSEAPRVEGMMTPSGREENPIVRLPSYRIISVRLICSSLNFSACSNANAFAACPIVVMAGFN